MRPLLYSLVQSCNWSTCRPFAYLKDVLLRLATHPHRQIADLTPKNWARTVQARSVA